MGFWIELLILQRQRRYPICKPWGRVNLCGKKTQGRKDFTQGTRQLQIGASGKVRR